VPLKLLFTLNIFIIDIILVMKELEQHKEPPKETNIISKQTMVLGGNGYIGSYFSSQHPDLITPSSTQLDILKPISIKTFLEEHKPKLVINLAAYTDVAAAEKQRGKMDGDNWQTNVIGVKNLVESLEGTGIPLIQISTDFVFSGSANDPGPYSESHQQGNDKELSAYGNAKKAGESIFMNSDVSGRLIRISYPYGVPGSERDFATWMLNNYDKYPLYNDQTITPTFIPQLLKVIEKLSTQGNLSSTKGILHVASTDTTTPYQFGQYLVKKLGRDPTLIEATKFKSKISKPVHGGLAVAKNFGGAISPWKDGVDAFVIKVNNSNSLDSSANKPAKPILPSEIPEASDHPRRLVKSRSVTIELPNNDSDKIKLAIKKRNSHSNRADKNTPIYSEWEFSKIEIEASQQDTYVLIMVPKEDILKKIKASNIMQSVMVGNEPIQTLVESLEKVVSIDEQIALLQDPSNYEPKLIHFRKGSLAGHADLLNLILEGRPDSILEKQAVDLGYTPKIIQKELDRVLQELKSSPTPDTETIKLLEIALNEIKGKRALVINDAKERLTVTETGLEDVLIIKEKRFNDDRGFFREVSRLEPLGEIIGKEITIKQLNHSRNVEAGIARGFHYEPWEKIITVTEGVVACALLDVRKHSPTLGEVEVVYLGYGKDPSGNKVNGGAIYIPEGIANFGLTVEGPSDYTYAVTDVWTPETATFSVNMNSSLRVINSC
jgi:dTDP-4-dehydrorhamnose reductase